MRKKTPVLFLLLCLGFNKAAPQEAETLSLELDSIFDTSPGDTVISGETGEAGEENGGSPEDAASGGVMIDTLKKNRVTLSASYDFLGGFSPGWSEAPWQEETGKFNYVLGAKMEALLALDFQISEHLRVWNSFYFSIPDHAIFSLKEFYFDYDMGKILFLRGGQYAINWGISPNFPFANLPARIPERLSGGDSYGAKLELPIGIGGLQFLVMTREGFLADKGSPRFEEFAYGLKCNLAFPSVDIDMGYLFHMEMPKRFSLSVKTTLGDTEWYTEGLMALPYGGDNNFRFSGSAGFLRDFFSGKLTLGGEAFYNGERGVTYYWRDKSDLRDAESDPLFEGLNGALNFIFRPGFLGMRVFTRCLYSMEEKSAQLVPGISIKPGSLITTTLSVPMVLGRRDDNNYYRHNVDTENRPFSIILGIRISGAFHRAFYLEK
ncbi:MAG: hypothetical protein LBG84_07265 [Treponema sp.]|nr:hypothetical protein [Treponema sp.]